MSSIVGAMKYTCEIDIDLPKERVIELMLDPEHYSSWQSGLLGVQPISSGTELLGRKLRLRFAMGNVRSR